MRLLRRVLAGLVRGLALFVVFVGALVGGLLLHLNHPRAQRLVLGVVDRALADVVSGRIAIEELDRLGVRGATIGRAAVFDPEGRRVIVVQGARVRLAPLANLRSALLGSGPRRIVIDSVEVSRVALALIEDDRGLSLARAFEPRTEEPPGPGARPVIVELPRIAVARTEVRGGMQALPEIDVVLQGSSGAVRVTPDVTRVAVDVARFAAQRLPAVGAANGALHAELAFPSADSQQPFSGRARLRGTALDAPVSANAEYAGERLAASVQVGPVPPSSLDRLLPGSTWQAPLSVELDVAGPLHELSARAHAALAGATADVRARGRLEPEPAADVELELDDLNLRLIHHAAPVTRLSARAELYGLDSDLNGSFRLWLPRSELGEVALPPVQASGGYSRRGLQASVHIDEPGAPTDVDVDFRAGRRSEHGRLPARAEFRLETRIDELERVPRLSGSAARGSVELHARGRWVLAEPPEIDADVRATLSGLSVAGVRVEAGRLQAAVSGAPDAPDVNAALAMSGLEVGPYRFQHARFTSCGNGEGLALELAANGSQAAAVSARGWLDPARAELSGLTAQLRRHADAAELHAQRVAIERGGVALEGVRVDGVGQITFDGRIAEGGTRFTSSGRRVELAAISRLAGLDSPLHAGQLSYDLAWREQSDGADAQLTARASGLSMFDVRGGHADVDLALAGRQIDGSVRARLGRIATLDADLEHVLLPARVRGPMQLLDATGALSLALRADLSRLGREAELPLERLEGVVQLNVQASRTATQPIPDLELALATRGFHLVGAAATAELETAGQAERSRPFRISGVDLDGALRFRGESGKAELDVKLVDREGDLVRVAAASRMPEDRPALAALGSYWRTLPIELHASVPERSMRHMPEFVRASALRGRVSAELDATGTLGDPELAFAIRGRRVRATDGRTAVLEFAGSADYADRRARARLEVLAGKRRAAWAELGLEADLPALIAHGSTEIANLELGATADRFPLHGLLLLRDRRIAGWASGSVELREAGRDRRLNAQLRVAELEVGEVVYEQARLDARADVDGLELSAALAQRDGSAELELAAPLAWRARFLPEIDEARPTTLQLAARNVRIAALTPFVDSVVSTIDGRVDAEIDARLQRGATSFRGHAKLQRGVVHVPALGQELRQVEADFQLEPEGLVRLERAVARAQTGLVAASGVARFDGLSLREARLRARIPERRELPLTLEGISYGQASGELELRAVNRPETRTVELEVELPRLHLERPQKPQHQVQDLDDDPRIRTGVYLASEKFASLPLQPLEPESEPDAKGIRWVAHIHLGKDVWVNQGTTFRVRLDGDVQVELADPTKVTGTIRLVSGRVYVQGKQFEIESGTIRFGSDDPTNPTVVATASWESPDDYTVYVEFRGPIQTGDLELRSEPPLQESEILSLLLFGAPDGQLGASAGPGQGSGTAAAALGVGGGVAARGLNRALSDLTTLDLQARVDTSSGSPTPELAWQVSRRITAELGYSVGDPGPGQPEDRTFLTLDWRIRQRWSISTTIGDRGSTRWDVLWRYRY